MSLIFQYTNAGKRLEYIPSRTEIKEIFRLRQQGYTQRSISLETGIAMDTLIKILKGNKGAKCTNC